jgi:ribosome-associated protein
MEVLLEAFRKKEKIIEILENKKAKDMSVIDIGKISSLADFFIICSGTSSTHIKALSDELDFKMKELGLSYLHKEGYETARWVLMDYGDIVVHIFHEEERSFYKLERLWSDGMVSYR